MADSVPIRKTSSVFDQIKEMQDRIMQRAYEIFEHSGGAPGRDFENWAQAERETVWRPALELSERDGVFQLEADIMFTAEVRHEHRENKGTVHYCEFETGRMFRSIRLPKKINPDKVKAEFKNGLLRLTAEIADESRGKKIKPEAA
jgi:HSP20 family protein